MTPRDSPQPVRLEQLLAEVDLTAVRHVVHELFSPGGNGFVRDPKNPGAAPTTVEDSQRVIAVFDACGGEAPEGLRGEGGNVITPRRALSIFCDPAARATRDKMFIRGTLAQWPDVRDRLYTRGADRVVAIALWALADDLRPDARELLRGHLRRLWAMLPPSTPAAEELARALHSQPLPLDDADLRALSLPPE